MSSEPIPTLVHSSGNTLFSATSTFNASNNGSCTSIPAPVHPGDADVSNPHNFSQLRKHYIVGTTLLTITSGTLTSALPSGLTPHLIDYFSLTPDSPALVLPTSLFLLAFAIGPLAFSPLSETHGRRLPLLSTFFLFTGASIGCALAPTWPAFLIFRFLLGLAASCPFAIAPGIFADLYPSATQRGGAIMLIMALTTLGPVLGPILAGATSSASWRVPFGITASIAGFTLAALAFMPETYPTHLRRCRPTWATTLGRPLHMLLTEPIVALTCAHLAIGNGLYYLAFELYPLIFRPVLPLHHSSLPLLPIGLGSVLAGVVFHWFPAPAANPEPLPTSPSDTSVATSSTSTTTTTTTTKRVSNPLPERHRLPLAIIGGPVFAGSIFWLGWTADAASVHWSIPATSGVFFGLGIELVFMSLVNYSTDVYGREYAASASAASIVTRFGVAAGLPLATTRMYHALGGAGGAGSVLGALAAVTAAVPVLIWWAGPEMRRRSGYRPVQVHVEVEGKDGGGGVV